MKNAAPTKKGALELTRAQREEAAKLEFQDLAPEDFDIDDNLLVSKVDSASAVSKVGAGGQQDIVRNRSPNHVQADSNNNARQNMPARASPMLPGKTPVDELMSHDDY